MKALGHEKIKDVFQLIDLFDKIGSFQYIDEYGACTTLNSSESMDLKILWRFLQLKAARYSNDCLTITYDDFN